MITGSSETVGRMIGYARVSRHDQDLSLQLDALKAAGCRPAHIFKDRVSGARDSRPGLDKCLEVLRDGDTLIVWRLDRLGRSLPHLIRLIEDLRERGIGFRSLRDGVIDTTTASGELIFNVFCALAQFERRLLQERTRAGLEAARARGRMGGRKQITADDPRVKTAQTMYANKKLSVKEICETLNISRATLYRWVELEG